MDTLKTVIAFLLWDPTAITSVAVVTAAVIVAIVFLEAIGGIFDRHRANLAWMLVNFVIGALLALVALYETGLWPVALAVALVSRFVLRRVRIMYGG